MAGQTNRRYPRVPVQLTGTLCILIPEETFQPIVHDVRVCDLSERGAMVEFTAHESTIKALLRSTRYCRLSFHGSPELPEKIIGKAVWVQPIGSGEHVLCRIGLFFEQSPDEAVSQLRAYIEKRLRELVDTDKP
ncbi:MAG: PilZ domain-containing protein [Candidatus Sumerlaeaceae bacterium]